MKAKRRLNKKAIRKKTFRKLFAKRMILAFLLPVSLVFAILCLIFYITIKEEKEHETQVYTKLLSDAMKEEIDKYVSVVEVAAKQEKVVSLDYTVAEPFLQEIMEQSEAGVWSHFVIANIYGTEQVHTDGEESHGMSIAREECFKRAWENRDTFVCEPAVSKSTGRNVLAISTPIIRKGKEVGVLIGFVNLSYISDVLNNNAFTEDSSVIMLNKDGLVSAAKDNQIVLSENWVTEKAGHSEKEQQIYKKMTQQKMGTGVAKHNGEWCVFTYRPVGVCGLSIVNITPFTQMYRTLNFLLIGFLISIVIVVAVCLISSLLLSGAMQQLIFWIREETAKLAVGNTMLSEKKIKFEHTIEIDELKQGMELLAENLERMLSKLDKESTVLFKTVDTVTGKNVESKTHIEDVYGAVEAFTSQIISTSNTVSDLHARSEKSCHFTDSITRYALEGSELAEQILERSNEDLLKLTAGIEHAQEMILHIEKEVEEAISETKKLDKINALVDEIKAITKKTTLLSLNASIEAARAQEGGRGFSVVALEIRELAEKSTKTASDISILSNDVSEVVEKLVKSVTKILAFINHKVIVDYHNFLNSGKEENRNTKMLEEIMQKFHTHVEELQAEFEQMNGGISGISSNMDQNTKSVTVIRESVKNLSGILGDMLCAVEDGRESAKSLRFELNQYR